MISVFVNHEILYICVMRNASFTPSGEVRASGRPYFFSWVEDLDRESHLHNAKVRFSCLPLNLAIIAKTSR